MTPDVIWRKISYSWRLVNNFVMQKFILLLFYICTIMYELISCLNLKKKTEINKYVVGENISVYMESVLSKLTGNKNWTIFFFINRIEQWRHQEGMGAFPLSRGSAPLPLRRKKNAKSAISAIFYIFCPLPNFHLKKKKKKKPLNP